MESVIAVNHKKWTVTALKSRKLKHSWLLKLPVDLGLVWLALGLRLVFS